MQKKNFNAPDETKTPTKATIAAVEVHGRKVVRLTYEPGWKWSAHIQPLTGTPSCQMHHLIYAISGNLKTVMDDGTTFDIVPGDVVDIPPGHDAWVVGDEPFVALDIA
jgi:quercetin dioxygenase-like cupin family protein